jgi:nucleoside-diphosphate-sugar epimerase
MTHTVLIIGANGRLGSEATRAFHAAGWQVLTQARSPTNHKLPSVRAMQSRLDEVDALAREAAGAKVVVYAVNPPYTRWAAEALPLARHAMDVAERLKACFMLPGNVYNFGAAMPPLLLEDTPQQALTRKGRIRVDMEAELQTRTDSGRMRSIVLRAGDFYGSGTGSWLDLVITKDLRQGKLVYPGPLNLPHAWAYLPDLVQAMVALATQAAQGQLPAAFNRFHFEGHRLTGAECLAAVERAAAALHLRPKSDFQDGGFKHGSLPWGLIRAGGIVWPQWRELAEMAYLWDVPHALSGAALRAFLGADSSALTSTPVDIAFRDSLVALGMTSVAASRTFPPHS